MKLPHYGEESERMLRSHLSLVHGIYVGDVKGQTALVIVHDVSHDDPDPHFVLAHTHDAEPDPTLFDVDEEWKW